MDPLLGEEADYSPLYPSEGFRNQVPRQLGWPDPGLHYPTQALIALIRSRDKQQIQAMGHARQALRDECGEMLAEAPQQSFLGLTLHIPQVSRTKIQQY